MECLFCKIVDKTIPADWVYEDDQVIAFNDINPQAPVHQLIIPRQHIATINDLDTSHKLLVGHMVTVARDLAAEAGMAENGYRLLFNVNSGGGQEVYHIHLHLVGGRQMTWPPG